MLLLIVAEAAHAFETKFNSIAYQYDLNPTLLAAIAKVESSNNPLAVNRRTHDYGLMQLNIRNLQHWKLSPTQALNADVSIKYAAKLLQGYKRRFGHEPKWACRYNLGTGRNVPSKAQCEIYYNKLLKAGYMPYTRSVATNN
jgi:soluble lytic murein transglycosylase-like protein